MLIDWFTVIAQIINFLILMGLLKHFLYDRIIAAMDERQRKVDERLADSEDQRKQAEEEKEELAGERRELDERRREMLDEAHREADKWRQDKIAETRREVEKLRDRWRRDIEREKKSFVMQLKKLIGRETYALAGDFFGDLGDRELEKRLIGRFAGMVADLDEEERRSFVDGAEKNDGKVRVVSAFELDNEERRTVEQACSKILDIPHEVEFSTDSEVILGLELQVAGYRISLSLGRYLAMLEERLQTLFERRTEDGGAEERGGAAADNNVAGSDSNGDNGD